MGKLSDLTQKGNKSEFIAIISNRHIRKSFGVDSCTDRWIYSFVLTCVACIKSTTSIGQSILFRTSLLPLLPVTPTVTVLYSIQLDLRDELNVKCMSQQCVTLTDKTRLIIECDSKEE